MRAKFCTVNQFSSVQLLSRVRLFATPGTSARQSSLSITNTLSLLKLMSIESVMPSSRLILCRPLLLPPSIVRILNNYLFLIIKLSGLFLLQVKGKKEK